jgi:hypothetical protein
MPTENYHSEHFDLSINRKLQNKAMDNKMHGLLYGIILPII